MVDGFKREMNAIGRDVFLFIAFSTQKSPYLRITLLSHVFIYEGITKIPGIVLYSYLHVHAASQCYNNKDRRMKVNAGRLL